jgi:hypothetical protein
MSTLRWVVVVLTGLILAPSFVRQDSRAQANTSVAATSGADNSLAAWNALVDRFFDDYFAFNPTAGGLLRRRDAEANRGHARVGGARRSL